MMTRNITFILICLLSWYGALASPPEFKTLLITAQGVGLINSESDCFEKTIRQALPGYVITKHPVKVGKLEGEYFELQQDGQVMLKVYPNLVTKKISRIHIFDNRAVAPGNVKLGAIYIDVFKSDEQIDCQAGIGDRDGQTLCSLPNTLNIRYIFEPKESSEAIIISAIEALNQARLVEIIWTVKDIPLTTKAIETDNSPASERIAPTEPATIAAPKSVVETPAISMLAMPVNIKTALKEQEKRLNDMYSSLNVTLAKLQVATPRGREKNDKPDNLNIFINAQRAWKKYRDDNCYWHSSLASDEGDIRNRKLVCLERMTRSRANEIEQVLKRFKR